MDKLDKQTYEIIKRLQNARISLLSNQPFYALLLLHMKFSLDITCETAYTDGERIAFNPDFINELSDKELEFVLMHEVLHTALGHPFRKQSEYEIDCFDRACDIVVNSNILYSFDMDIDKITLNKYGVAMHETPNGDEGYMYSVEEVYDVLLSAKTQKANQTSDTEDNSKTTDNINAGSDNSDVNNKNSKDNKDEENDSGNDSSTCNGADEISEEQLSSLISKLLQSRTVHGKLDPDSSLSEDKIEDKTKEGQVDDHSFWNGDKENNAGRDIWLNRMIEATDIIASSESGASRGIVPLAADRIIQELKNPVLDWRTILNDFVQEEICDYSFSPPDKRMDDSPFFLPDFNEKDESVKDILFMIDTSGSMSDEQITECYSEIYGAIGQFNGKLQGKLGFFDAVVVEPIPFEDEDEFKIIRPKGGGGTSFDAIFTYINKKMSSEPPASIVILTDGYAPFPDESAASGIPVLWIINNRKVNPPWGKIARITEQRPTIST